MKTVLKLSLIAILLFCTTFANGQLADTTLYKVKLEKFNTQARASKIATFSGIGLFAVGGVFGVMSISKDNKCSKWWDQFQITDDVIDRDRALKCGDQRDNYLITACVVGGAGIITAVISGINWGTGKNKIKQYQIKLDDARAYFSPNQVGLKLAFKF